MAVATAAVNGGSRSTRAPTLVQALGEDAVDRVRVGLIRFHGRAGFPVATEGFPDPGYPGRNTYTLSFRGHPEGAQPPARKSPRSSNGQPTRPPRM